MDVLRRNCLEFLWDSGSELDIFTWTMNTPTPIFKIATFKLIQSQVEMDRLYVNGKNPCSRLNQLPLEILDVIKEFVFDERLLRDDIIPKKRMTHLLARETQNRESLLFKMPFEVVKKIANFGHYGTVWPMNSKDNPDIRILMGSVWWDNHEENIL